MFTGIVRGIGQITEVVTLPGLTKLAVALDTPLLSDLQKGASIAVDGVCLTVVDFDSSKVWFDVIDETLQRTTLKSVKLDQQFNIERSARFGDEIGGHIVSGHVFGTVAITSIERTENNCILTFRCPPEWTKYLFPKGFITLNGASLTLVDVDKKKGGVTVHLIPETLQRTTFGSKQVGDLINMELDTHTQTIVDTLENISKISTSPQLI